MDRRNFLKGTFGGVVAGGVIIAATDADIAAFATQVTPDAVVGVNPRADEHMWAGVGEMVFNHRGDPVGVVSRISTNQEAIDISPMGNGGGMYKQYMPGLKNVEYTVVASGFAPMRATHQRTK